MKLETARVVIKEGHVDSLGHMNNATYLQLFEEARWDVITHRGFGFKEMHSLKQGPIILECNVKFMKEVHLRETIEITTEVIDYPGKVGRLKQQMIRLDGTVVCEAIFTVAFFDLKLRKIIEPTEEWKKALGM